MQVNHCILAVKGTDHDSIFQISFLFTPAHIFTYLETPPIHNVSGVTGGGGGGRGAECPPETFRWEFFGD